MHAARVDGPSKGEIADIPSGITIDVLGPAAVPGFLEFRWQDRLYSVYSEDLAERSVKVRDAAV